MTENTAGAKQMPEQSVLLDYGGDGTATIILNRPEKRNALSTLLIAQLQDALRSLEEDNSIRAIVLTGAPGGPFSGLRATHFEGLH